MAGFIFGIIFVIAGIIAAVCFAKYQTVEEKEEYVLDEDGNRVRSSYGGYRTTTKKVTIKPFAKYSVYAAPAPPPVRWNNMKHAYHSLHGLHACSQSAF